MTHYNQALVGYALPYWISLQRSGNTLTAGYSADGINWSPYTSIDIPMTEPVYIGLALTAANAAATCTAVFSNVVGLTPSFTSQDIGIKNNVAAPVYVTLQDSGARTATVTHVDPNILLNTAWQVWDIPLSAFAGVNKNAITKLTVGVGTHSVSTGTIYVDDIRLYIPRCLPNLLKPLADFTNDCIVDYADLDIMAEQWLTSGSNLEADVYYDNNVNLKDYTILADTWLEELLWPQ
jgi:hypothetical protein